MKKGIFALLGVFLIASCGGGGSNGGGPTPTPTSDSTKAVTKAAADETMSAAGAGTMNGFENMTPSAMVVKGVEKATYAGNINTTYNCRNGGTVGVTGTINAVCTGSEETDWSCSPLETNMNLVFTDCARSVDVNGTTYNVIINGNGTAVMTGSASGVGQTIAQATFSGTFTGTPAISGCANGMVDLSNLRMSGSIEGEAEPTVTCEGTTTVTLDSVQQICGVTSDCTSCSE